MEQIRLQKYLADAGIASRRKAEELIKQGKVYVNGKIVNELGTKVTPNVDEIRYEGKKVEIEEKYIYILLNKPIGYVTTVKDQFNRDSVMDLVKIRKRLVPVGRLDMYTSGALILTNDGEFVYKVTHPKHEIEKTYTVTIKGIIKKEEVKNLEIGVDIGEYITKPAKVKILKTDEEKNIVYYGPAEKKHIFYKAKNTDHAGEMDFTYFNATYTVENALSKVKDDKGMKRVEKFLKEEICPECQGTRLSKEARKPLIRGIGLDKACQMPLNDLVEWVRDIPDSMPDEMKPMAREICDSFLDVSKRLLDLGLGYLSLDRAASTLSTGERQRMQLARAVRNRTTGILYVLDEPSIGLHPSNIYGLIGVMNDLIHDGNSILLVDHDTEIIKEANWLIEMGPEAGKNGGYVFTEGTIEQIKNDKKSMGHSLQIIMMKKCVQYLQLNNYLNLEKFIFQQIKYIQSIL